jgi:hypothetical protein
MGGASTGGTAGGGAGSGGQGGRRPLQPDDGCSIDGFCQVAPDLTSEWLFDVWGSGPRDVWAVGNAGTIVHYDGDRWTRIASGTEADLRGVWGTSRDDVWFVGEHGTTIHYDGVELDATRGPVTDLDLQDVHALADRVWIVAGANSYPRAATGYGVVFHGRGAQFTPAQPSNDGLDYRAVWLTPEGGAWFAGDRTIHFDGLDFFERNIGSANGVWAADGRAWVTSLSNVYISEGPMPEVSLDLNATIQLTGIWGTSPEDLWVVGGDGTIVRNDGSSWTPTPSGTQAHLQAVWGSSPRDVWAVGSNGTILHFDGSSWSRSPSSPDEFASYAGIWGASDDVQWIAGASGISAYDGDRTVRFATVMGGSGVGYSSIWGTRADDVVAVGGNGRIAEYDGGAWRDVASPTAELLYAVWGHSNRMVAVGDGRFGVERWGDDIWRTLGIGGGTGTMRSAIWGSADDDFWVASPLSGVLAHLAGDQWTARNTQAYMSALWGSSSDDIWGVGFESVYHYDGDSWDPVRIGDDIGLVAIAGCSATEVWATGVRGALYRYDGRDWSPRVSGTDVDLHGLRCSPGGVWVVGDTGIVLRNVVSR